MSVPPPLPWAVRTGPERLILAVSAAALLLAGFVAVAGFVLPGGWVCGWKSWTGLPCAGCGGTRALQFLGSGRWSEALCLNPGAVLGAAILALANAYALAVLVFRRQPWRPHFPAWRWAIAGGVAANWVYLLAVSRP